VSLISPQSTCVREVIDSVYIIDALLISRILDNLRSQVMKSRSQCDGGSTIGPVTVCGRLLDSATRAGVTCFATSAVFRVLVNTWAARHVRPPGHVASERHLYHSRVFLRRSCSFVIMSAYLLSMSLSSTIMMSSAILISLSGMHNSFWD
jgi:hypothetical protein